MPAERSLCAAATTHDWLCRVLRLTAEADGVEFCRRQTRQAVALGGMTPRP